MCGLVGYIGNEKMVSYSGEKIKSLGRVLDGLSYRGPDGSGTWKSEQALLGHRRLSIIDLSAAGAQPFVDKERGLVITFNGELYNYRDLRALLQSKGYTFHSLTDTEVILCAYEHYGVDFLTHLRGMFAFCLFDQKEKLAILARDPVGEKPLYYYLDSERLIFSSEIKGFHAFSEIDLSIDVESVKAFFALQYIPGPHTVYRNIQRLAPGSALVLDIDRWNVRHSRFWSFENLPPSPTSPEEIEALLSESVRYRLIADVEVALLLSGGIDSALLASFAQRNGANLRVFTARFEEENLDEYKYARQVADQLHLEQIVVTGGQITPEIFDRVIFHGDELLGDPACVPTFLLSREIANHVKVVLSGEGADELFWGYDTYRLEKAWRKLAWMRPAFSHVPGFQTLVSAWDMSHRIPASLTRMAKIVSAAHDLGAARWTTVFADPTLSRFIPSNNGNLPYLQEMEARTRRPEGAFSGYEAALTGDLVYWLADDLLMKVDRMTMAHGVEARAPFLAPELMLAALRLPQQDKIRGKSGKFVLRQLVEKHFPGETGKALAWRKKHGFEVPVNAWLRNPLRECVEDRLSRRKLAASGLLDVDLASMLKDNFYRSQAGASLRRKMWLLLCFQTWYELHETGFGFR